MIRGFLSEKFFVLCVPVISVLMTCFLFQESTAAVSGALRPGDTLESEEILRVIPGEGVGDLKLGLAVSTVIKIMGEPSTRVDYGREKELWERAGYDPDQEIQFYRGFDYCLEYDGKTNRGEYPVWKIYVKKERVVYMILSSYVYPSFLKKKTGIPPQAFLGSLRYGIKKSLGDSYFEFVDAEGNVNIHFLDKGISFVVTDDRIGVVNIYPPFSEEESKNFLKSFEKKTDFQKPER